MLPFPESSAIRAARGHESLRTRRARAECTASAACSDRLSASWRDSQTTNRLCQNVYIWSLRLHAGNEQQSHTANQYLYELHQSPPADLEKNMLAKKHISAVSRKGLQPRAHRTRSACLRTDPAINMTGSPTNRFFREALHVSIARNRFSPSERSIYARGVRPAA